MIQPKKCTVAELAEFFERCRDEIIREWVLQAGALLQELHLDKPTITNHVPDVVDEIARDLASSRDGVISPAYTRGITPAHGMQRFHDGLDVGEVVAEYNLLRVACNTVAEKHDLFVAGEVAQIVNHRIDEAVRMSVVAFAARQSVMRKEQEIEHLSFIAHDLRTPLNAVSLVVDELSRGLDKKALDEAGDLFDILRRNMLRVEDLIKKVLETSEQSWGRGGSFRPERRHFELWPLVQRLILDLQSISTAHSIQVVNEVPLSLTIFADASLIAQVFQNLLGNAFEYTSNGKVVVSALENDGGITCVVKDSGAGIPPEMLAKVFEKLATDPDKSGTGLGLAIVKQIVEAHGGTVGAESVQGAGATFTFKIPAENIDRRTGGSHSQ